MTRALALAVLGIGLRHGLQAGHPGWPAADLQDRHPGVSPIRVKNRKTDSDHEQFSAIDLVVEGEKS
jgi:hypothetical protein